MSDEDEGIDGRIIDAARRGDRDALARLLDAHPDKLTIRAEPYGASLLHLAASDAACIELLLGRGLDVNARESGDNTPWRHSSSAATAPASR